MGIYDRDYMRAGSRGPASLRSPSASSWIVFLRVLVGVLFLLYVLKQGHESRSARQPAKPQSQPAPLAIETPMRQPLRASRC
jgi:hypothetical protein